MGNYKKFLVSGARGGEVYVNTNTFQNDFSTVGFKDEVLTCNNSARG